jgi:hypothetical protein
LKEKYDPIIEEESKKVAEAKARQKEILKKGLKDAYSSLKPGGSLIIPMDVTLRDVNLPEVLGVAEERVVLHKLRELLSNLNDIRESPVLPQNTRGMGTRFGDYYTVIKLK